MIGVLVAVGSVDLEADVLPALDTAIGVHVVRRCVDMADLMAVASTGQAGAVLVALSLRGLDADSLSQVAQHGVSVIGLCAAEDDGDRATLTRIGADVVVTPDDVADLPAIMGKARRWSGDEPEGAPTSRPRPTATEAVARGRTVAVWGPSGAPGRSTVALGLAAESARLGVTGVLVDADVYGGSLGQMLGLLDETSGLLAAARAANVGALEPSTLARHTRQVDAQLRVLTGLPRADRWIEVPPVLLRAVLDACRGLGQLTVVDCGFSLERDEEIVYDTAAPRRNGATLEALERADTVLVVGAADPIGLGRLIRGLDELVETLPSVAPWVVINRARSSLGWSSDEISETVRRATGFPVMAVLPDDPVPCDHALVNGRCLSEVAPDAKLTRELRALAAAVVGVAAPAGRRIRRRTAARAR